MSSLVPHPPNVKQAFFRGFPVVFYFHMNFCDRKELVNKLLETFTRSLPPRLLRMHITALGEQPTLPQQLHSHLQPRDVVVDTAVWSTPNPFPTAWLAGDAHQAGPVCPVMSCLP